ncbi:hypothetical protein KA405_04635 [Patescibacteria group bacterium]|nr:hypothetical protein [Patescibacteria group bacterium]
MRSYKKSIQKINAINWSEISPEKIISVSLFFAKEFASTVRSCIPLYGINDSFQQFIVGEIDTDNLQYEDYNETADHWEFLDYFMQKYSLIEDVDSWERFSYTSYVNVIYPSMQLLTLVSREKDLQGIFQNLLVAHDWNRLGFGFYKYFLERHLELDGNEGGHEDLMHELIDIEKLDKNQIDCLDAFWKLRLDVYDSLLD